MKSNNPVFNNSPQFNGQAAYPQGGYPPPPPGAQAYGTPAYGDPSTWGTGAPGVPQATRAMTIDDVVQKTGISLGVVVIAAAITWIATGDVASGDAGMLGALTGLGMVVGLAIGLYATFSRKMLHPGVVLVYAAAQGLFMGGISKTYDAVYANGIVVQALFGTVFAAAGVLAVYKFFNIKISDKFAKGFFAFCLGFLGLGLMELALSAFGQPIGLFGDGGMGFVFAAVGLVIGLVGLLMDFDMVENGIRAGVEERFAWTAAFGLTASIVMVYFYLLRILAILQSDD